MVYIVYVSAEIGQIKDAKGNKSKGSTRNLPDNLVSQEEVYYVGLLNINSNTLFESTDGKGKKCLQ